MFGDEFCLVSPVEGKVFVIHMVYSVTGRLRSASGSSFHIAKMDDKGRVNANDLSQKLLCTKSAQVYMLEV